MCFGVNALSGLYLISTIKIRIRKLRQNCVNALSGLYLISTPIKLKTFVARDIPVSMPSRAYNSFLPLKSKAKYEDEGYTCQCPLGLITHFYGKRVLPFAINVTTGCQCPLGLITHFYDDVELCDEADSISVSMPSRAYNSFLQEKCPMLYNKIECVSMPSRAYNSFLLRN